MTDSSAETLAPVGQVDGDLYWTTDRLATLEALLEIGKLGSKRATQALSNALQQSIVVEAPRLHTCPAHLVPKILGKSGDPVTVVFMQLRGPVDCELLLTFEMGEARKIAQTMGKTASISSSDKSMEKSAIEEIGSIMICSFLGAIADYCGIALLPTAPELIRDTFDAIVDGLLAKQALSSEIAMLFDTRFKRTDSTAEGILTMFLSPELQTMLLRKTAAPERQSP